MNLCLTYPVENAEEHLQCTNLKDEGQSERSQDQYAECVMKNGTFSRCKQAKLSHTNEIEATKKRKEALLAETC